VNKGLFENKHFLKTRERSLVKNDSSFYLTQFFHVHEQQSKHRHLIIALNL